MPRTGVSVNSDGVSSEQCPQGVTALLGSSAIIFRMSEREHSPGPLPLNDLGMDTDKYGVPLEAFGATVPPEFFELLGRTVAVNGKIEYLKDRLEHLPEAETSGVRKVEQFRRRYAEGRSARNAVVHSSWVFGAHMDDPEMIVGTRYKTRKQVSGDVATLSVTDVPGSEREQDVVQYSLNTLKELLRRDLVTMQIGELAYTEVMMRWATENLGRGAAEGIEQP